MTLQYLLFDKPGNIREFTEELAKTGSKEAELVLLRQRIMFDTYGPHYEKIYSLVRNPSGKIEYKNRAHASGLMFDPEGGCCGAEKSEYDVALERLVEWKEFLKSKGIAIESFLEIEHFGKDFEIKELKL